jgi:hypothetical protein
MNLKVIKLPLILLPNGFVHDIPTVDAVEKTIAPKGLTGASINVSIEGSKFANKVTAPMFVGRLAKEMGISTGIPDVPLTNPIEASFPVGMIGFTAPLLYVTVTGVEGDTVKARPVPKFTFAWVMPIYLNLNLRKVLFIGLPAGLVQAILMLPGLGLIRVVPTGFRTTVVI